MLITRNRAKPFKLIINLCRTLTQVSCPCPWQLWKSPCSLREIIQTLTTRWSCASTGLRKRRKSKSKEGPKSWQAWQSSKCPWSTSQKVTIKLRHQSQRWKYKCWIIIQMGSSLNRAKSLRACSHRRASRRWNQRNNLSKLRLFRRRPIYSKVIDKSWSGSKLIKRWYSRGCRCGRISLWQPIIQSWCNIWTV